MRKSLLYLFMATMVVSLSLTACGSSSDGSAGTTGADGADGQDLINVISYETTITAVTMSGTNVQIDFSIADQDGTAAVGISASGMRFHIAQLSPATGGKSSYWTSHINTTQEIDTGFTTVGQSSWPAATGSPAGSVGDINNQPTSETGSTGTWTDNGDGTYRYVTSVALADIVIAEGPNARTVTYDATATHRVATQLSDGSNNASFDFVPDGSAVTVTRDVVKIENCNECHGKLAMHGGGRVDTKLCVICHNPTNGDPFSGNVLDLKIMIHKLHRGENLPSIDDEGGTYAIWGYRNTKHDYTELGLPMDIRNCTKCHDATDDADTNDRYTADGDNWKNNPSSEVCGSCHDNAGFATGTNFYSSTASHTGGNRGATDVTCSTCHTATLIAGVHTDNVAAADLSIAIDSATFSGTGAGDNKVTVVFHATVPSTGDYIDLAAGNSPFSSADADVTFAVGWPAVEHTNVGSGSGPAMPLTDSTILASLAAATGTCPTDCTFTVDVTLPDGVELFDDGVVAWEGHPDDGAGEELNVKSAVSYFDIVEEATSRRQVVSIEDKCDKCHVRLEFHGGRRADNEKICVICHNPNNTDINKRPADAPTGTTDSKMEESIDFKRLIHGLHAGDTSEHGQQREDGLIVWGYKYPPGAHVGVEHDFSHVRFPGKVNNCDTCHVDDSYELPLATDSSGNTIVLGSTIDSVPAATDRADTASGHADFLLNADDENISPTAAVCSSCHDNSYAQAHMETNGAVFSATDANVPTIEPCTVCHGPGREFDLKVVHGMEDADGNRLLPEIN